MASASRAPRWCRGAVFAVAALLLLDGLTRRQADAQRGLGVIESRGVVAASQPVRSLQDCYSRNQVTRASVTSWVARSDWLTPPSLFNYGLPDSVFHLINNNVGPLPIGHDLISFLGSQLLSVARAREPRLQPPRRLHYFEVGVSVGKCLFTQLEFFGPSALIFAYDLEDINPSFAHMLVPSAPAVLDSFTEEQLKPGQSSIRRQPGMERIDTIKKFVSPAGGELLYLASDEFNSAGWAHLKRQNLTFDLLYSDAFHDPTALIFEAEQLLNHGLINLQSFAIVWDDCSASMEAEALCPMLLKLRAIPGVPPLFNTNFMIHGWLGTSESEHRTCILSTLDLYHLRKSDVAFAALPTEEAC
jgi:hypothetical protein